MADRLAIDSGIGKEDRLRLRWLGEAINYNAYGDDERDVCIATVRLYAVMARYPHRSKVMMRGSPTDHVKA